MTIQPTLADRSCSMVPASLGKLFCVWLMVILCLKWPTLIEPPVWDAVWGLFPAAGDLADNGFNLPSLLTKPNCGMGGPNTHSESLVTWITAVVLRFCGKGPRAFVVLHTLHFCAAAWMLAVLQRFLISIWGRGLAGVFTGMLLLCPLFRVQVGAMYFEIPLAACTVTAVVAYVTGHQGRAVFWATLGVLVKQTALILIGALAVASFCQRGSLGKRCTRSLSFAICGFAAAFWPLISSTSALTEIRVKPSGSFLQHMSLYHFQYLAAVPDITAAFCLVALVGLIRLREVWLALSNGPNLGPAAATGLLNQESLEAKSDRTEPADKSTNYQTAASATGVSFLLVIMFALFIYVVPYFAHVGHLGLPRYFVFILPFVFFALTQWLKLLTSARLAMIVLTVVAILFVGNREGLWYPKDPGDEISVLERGENYRWLVVVQREAAQAAANLPDDVVVYYGFAEHFFLKYPWQGYADRTHPGGRCLALREEKPESLNLKDFPKRFFVVYTNPRLFGYEAHKLLRNATKDPSRQVQLFRRCQRGPYRIDIVEVTTIAKSELEQVTP